MRTTMQRWALLGVVMGCLVAMGLVAPANAAGVTQFSGSAVYESAGECGTPPTGFDSYPGLVLSGSLEGCLYTMALTVKQTPSGVYLETGRELIIARLNGGPEGTFETTYRFEGKYDASGAEIHGRCQHPIVEGSGTGGFAGAEGRIDFKDEVETGTFFYRGHITLG
jgi:hypothetical protein